MSILNFPHPPLPGQEPSVQNLEGTLAAPAIPPEFAALLALVPQPPTETATPEPVPQPGMLERILSSIQGFGTGVASGNPALAEEIATAPQRRREAAIGRNRELQANVDMRNAARRAQANQQRVDLLLKSLDVNSRLDTAEARANVQETIANLRQVIDQQKVDIDRFKAETQKLDVLSKADQRKMDSVTNRMNVLLDNAIASRNLDLKDKAIELNNRIQQARVDVEEGRLGIARFKALYEQELADAEVAVKNALAGKLGAQAQQISAQTQASTAKLSTEEEGNFSDTRDAFDKAVTIRNGQATFVNPIDGRTYTNIDEIIRIMDELWPNATADPEKQREFSRRFREHLVALGVKDVPEIPNPEAVAAEEEKRKAKIQKARNAFK